MDVPAVRPRGLAVPFALVGAVAAFFSVLACGAVQVGVREVSPLPATCSGLAVGALVGVVLQRWRALHHPFGASDSVAIRVGAVVVLAGAAIGGLVGVQAWGIVDAWPFVAGGAACAVAFLPSAIVVLWAARRAERARLGSLVAAVDRRGVWASLAAVCAFASSTQAPALVLGAWFERVPLLAQGGASIAVSVACLAVLAALRARDDAAAARLEAMGRDAASLDRAEAAASTDDAPTDLGLGADRWARVLGFDTYRSTARRSVVLFGSLDEARRAVDEARAHRGRCMRFTAALLVATTLAFAIGLVRAT